MGKLKGKITKPGDGGMLKYKNDAGEKIEVPYNQPLSEALGIVENATVTFTLLENTVSPMAVAVNPIEKGTIVDIDFEKGVGTIEETESGIKYPFKQNYLRESKFDKGQVVTYTLVSSNGTMIAVCLTAVQ